MAEPGRAAGDRAVSRRFLLQGLAVASAAVVAPGLRGTAIAARAKAPKALRGFVVHRFTTRGRHSCRACREHHKYKVFTTRAVADATRAHPGCNCPIVQGRMNPKLFRAFFGESGLAVGGVGDLRHPDVQPLLAKLRKRRNRRMR